MRRFRTLMILALLPLVWSITGTGRSDGPALESAPELSVEDLGPMSLKANVALGPVASTSSGTGFVQLLFSYPLGEYWTIKEPFTIIAVDLQTGTVTRTRASTRPGSVGWRVWTWQWGQDGKLYLGTQLPGHLICWDPRTQTARDLGLDWKGEGWVYRLVVGTDGAIYGGGANPSRAFRYDPQTDRLQDFGVLGLPRRYQPSYAYTLGADNRYVYVASGKIPWYIVAYDRQTGNQQNLLTFDQHDYPDVFQYPDSVYVKAMVSETGKPPRYEYYRLAEGKAVPVSTLPPARPRSMPVPDASRPDVLLDASGVSSGSGAARLWYRLAAAKATAPHPAPTDASPEQLGWRSVSIPVTVQPLQLRRLVRLPDGRLLGATGDYGDLFTFDPSTGRQNVLGKLGRTNVYSMLVADGKLYYTGYAGAPLWVYDPARPWTLEHETPLGKSPDEGSSLSNPRRLISLMATLGVHYGYQIVRDAWGRLYLGCHAERNRVGGALAIYDPRTGQTTGIGEPELTNYDCAGLAATSDGRLIVYSSYLVHDPTRPDGMPSEAKLFIYDPAAGRIVREIKPLPGRTSTGLLATGAPGQVVGASQPPQGKRTTLFAVEAASGKLIWQHDVAGLVPSRVHQGAFFQRGPDGQIWTFLDKVLVRIRPETGEVTPVGMIASGPGDAVFVGTDLYLAGTESLRRIRGVVPPRPVTRRVP